jgi:5-methylcytosine-specific restriction endonuclease McrA
MGRARRNFAPAVRTAALLHATYRCERCGSKSNLELHHRGNRADSSTFNCQVLCHECHTREHRRRNERNGRTFAFD